MLDFLMKQKIKLIIISCLIFIFGTLVCSPVLASYADDYKPMEKIPGFELGSESYTFPNFIANVYKFGIYAVGISALLMITIGGFYYMTAAGNTARLGTAKTLITDAILGLIVALGAWLLLYVINPDLVKINLDFSEVSKTASNDTIKPPTTDLPKKDCKESGSCSCSATRNSKQTNTFISCMKGKGNLTLGQETSNTGKHVCNPPNSISCHYGGTKCNGVGNAVDYGGPPGANSSGKDGEKYQAIVEAASECGGSIARCEDGNGKKQNCSASSTDHVHVTVDGNCGCT